MQVVTRQATVADFSRIQDLCKQVYPFSPPWTIEQLSMHQRIFPEGQIVAVDTTADAIVGFAFSLVIFWNEYDETHSWKDFTAGGFFTNHDPEKGRTLYGAEVLVCPNCRGKGVGKALYVARRELVKQLGVLRIRAGARLRGYGKYHESMSAKEYTFRVIHREIPDPTLSFQLREGFKVLGVVQNYLSNDPESLGYAAIIEWLNPAVAEQHDYEAQIARYDLTFKAWKDSINDPGKTPGM